MVLSVSVVVRQNPGASDLPFDLLEICKNQGVSISVILTMTAETKDRHKAKKEKKDKKEKKKHKKKESKEEKDNKDTTQEEETPPATTPSDPPRDDDKKRKRLEKKEKKLQLLAQLPKVDEDGISYTKIQLRRMRKRLERGLPPLLTPQEEDERRKQLALEKREEEQELAGFLYQGEGNEREEDKEEQQEDEEEEEEVGDNNVEQEEHEPEESSQPSNKKRKRNKPVPSDYVCCACQNQHSPKHWIYDCPNKVTQRGTNQVSKKLRGIHNPDKKKVFVSGLSFDAKRSTVEKLFEACGQLTHCKLLTFPDTGRCKGQAFLTFETEEAAHKAIRMTGTVLENVKPDDKKKKKKNKVAAPAKRTELKLKVTWLKNRTLTKQKSG